MVKKKKVQKRHTVQSGEYHIWKSLFLFSKHTEIILVAS